MHAYSYRAARPDGSQVRGVIEAPTTSEAGSILVLRGLYPLTITARLTPARGRAASRKDLALAFRSLATLVGAGIPAARALECTMPLLRPTLRAAFERAIRRLQEGRTLAQAMEEGQTMPAVVLGMLRAGERGGRLASTLEQVATHLEREAEFSARLRQALAYPLLLIVSGLASVVIMSTLVIPKFSTLLQEAGQELPLSTRILLGWSRLVINGGPWLVAGGVAGLLLARRALERPGGLYVWHKLLLRMPYIGSLRAALSTTRVARALGGALAAGVPMLTAIGLAQEAAGDAAVADRLARVRDRVSRGEALSAALAREQAATVSAIQLMAVGETAGQLALMAGRGADLAADEAERRLRTLMEVLEPGLVIALGGAVAFIAAALLQALYSLRPGVG